MSVKRSRKRQSQILAKRRTAPGTAPGTLSVDPAANATTINAIGVNRNKCEECVINSMSELLAFKDQFEFVWFDVVGLGSEATLKQLANTLSLHPLAMEDVVNVHQRVKIDEFPEHLFVVARMIDDETSMRTEQLSFFLKPGVLISFQERPGDCWNPVRQRIRTHRGRFAEGGVDYLLYTLLDTVIDSFFPIMERIADRVDAVEEAISLQVNSKQLASIHELRGQLLTMRRIVRPFREMLNELMRDSVRFIKNDIRVNIRDCYDHAIQLIETIETYRELTSDLRDYYMTSNSNSMNEVMKVLTIISTIFIPLSFIAGVYGMNFNKEASPWNMPELDWQLGYPFALGLMLCVAIALLMYFKVRKWF